MKIQAMKTEINKTSQWGLVCRVMNADKFNKEDYTLMLTLLDSKNKAEAEKWFKIQFNQLTKTDKAVAKANNRKYTSEKFSKEVENLEAKLEAAGMFDLRMMKPINCLD